MSERDTIGVAMTLCYFCGGSKDIILNTRLTTSAAESVKGLHGKVMNMEPCNACADIMKKGVVIIVIDEEKSGPDWSKEKPPNPWRTGHMVTVKDDYLKRIKVQPDLLKSILKARGTFMGEDTALKLGVIRSPAAAEFEAPPET